MTVITQQPMPTNVPRTQRPGQNAAISTATAPGVRPNSTTATGGGTPPGMRPEYSYDANGNRMVRYVPATPQGGAQAPVAGSGGTGPASAGPQTPTPPGPPQGAGTGGAGGPQNPANPIDPVDVQTGNPQLGNFQSYQDAAMAQARRQLDPVWEENQRRFEQTMINRGLSPGTEAYNRALDQFNRGKNDQYNAAQNQALQQGLAAQNQAFTQAFRESELANQLLRSREQNNTQLTIGGWNNEMSARNAEIGRQNFLDQLGFNQQQAGVAADQWNRQFGFGQQQWADQFGQSQQAQDFAQMMASMGFDRDTAWGNNAQSNAQFQQLASLFGMMAPQAQGTAPVDYLGALGQYQAGQQGNYQAGVNQANQQNASYLALLGALFCDETAKTVIHEADPARCLHIAEKMPLTVFEYTGDAIKGEYIGTMAQPFNRLLHGADTPPGFPTPVVRIMDLLGVLAGAVKELAGRVRSLEQTIGDDAALGAGGTA